MEVAWGSDKIGYDLADQIWELWMGKARNANFCVDVVEVGLVSATSSPTSLTAERVTIGYPLKELLLYWGQLSKDTPPVPCFIKTRYRDLNLV